MPVSLNRADFLSFFLDVFVCPHLFFFWPDREAGRCGRSASEYQATLSPHEKGQSTIFLARDMVIVSAAFVGQGVG